jgi:hypothetical protein
MSVDIQKIKLCLKGYEFSDFSYLFREVLGWDQRPEATRPITYRGQRYEFRLVAEKSGFKIYVHICASRIPSMPVLKQLDDLLGDYAAAHLTIFVDAQHENQLWLWIKRQGSQATTYPTFLNKLQSGELLAQKVRSLYIDLQDELQNGINLIDVIDRVTQGFDVERVTRAFYDGSEDQEGFKDQHKKFLNHILNISDEADRKWYASIMLNRLMFVYFIQRKGLLDFTDPNSFNGKDRYLQEHLEAIPQKPDSRFAFYREFLLPLFQGLNQRDYPRELRQIIGNVPYLNGGIFDEHPLEKKYSDIQINNEAFGDLFTFFTRFTWHLDDRPSRNDKEINPDVLGYIFEKYINQKEMGAYYTKEDITGYIGRNTIIPYIFEKVAQQHAAAFDAGGPLWSLLQQDPEVYIYETLAHGVLTELPEHIAAGINDVTQRKDWNQPADEQWALATETWREVVARRQHYDDVCQLMEEGQISTINDLITYNLDIMKFAANVITKCTDASLLHSFYDALTHVTILDPTCGSGAFLFAALNILRPLYQECLTRMDQLVKQHESHKLKLATNHFDFFQAVLRRFGKHQRQQYFILKSIIVNNLYGVDVMEEAIEICRLRFFLNLVAQLETPKDLEPLPDIDFNVLAGNTLIGFTSLDEVRQVTQKLFPAANTEATLARIEQKAQEVERAEQNFRDIQIETGISAGASAKQALQAILDDLRADLNPYFATEYSIGDGTRTDKNILSEEYKAWLKNYQPFHWWIEFHKIMHDGGFDVVIGNPPWKEYSVVRKKYTVQNLITEKSGNLYGICIERALKLRSPLGLLSFIVQLPLVNSSRMVSVRNLLKDRSSSIFTITFDDRPSKLFEGLQHCRSTIFISRAKGNDANTPVIATTKYQRWYADAREKIFALLEYAKIAEKHVYPDQFPKYASNLEVSVFGKVQAAQKYKAGLAFRQSHTEYFIFYQEATQYWIKATVGLPFYANNGEVGAPPHGRFLYFDSPEATYAIAALLNSNLFYIYFIAFGDCFHLSDRLVSGFPIADHILEDTQLITLSKNLMTNLKANAERKTIRTKDDKEISYDNYYGSKSKSIIDEIDRILARHYGFTSKELDFIISYDFKYRMGKGNGE